MHGRRSRWTVALCAATVGLALLGIARVGAITYGWEDEGRHPSVGVFFFGTIDGEVRQACSGTLIAPTVFLTASHCTTYLDYLEAQGRLDWVAVSFETEPPHITALHYGMHYTNPNFSPFGLDTGDVAVILLDAPVMDITPAGLPTAGMFNAWYGPGRRHVKDLKFTAVGYGRLEPQFGGGPPVWPSAGGVRRYAYSEFGAMDKVWLHLQMNGATGDGGTCYGDSGGPNFLWQNGEETPVIAGVTVKGDMMCMATNVIYRLDIPGARDFLEQFVSLP